MVLFLVELLFQNVTIVKDNTITYRTDYSNFLLLTNLVSIFIIYKQFRRVQLLVELSVANKIKPCIEDGKKFSFWNTYFIPFIRRYLYEPGNIR
jgi:hypothetical protein